MKSVVPENISIKVKSYVNIHIQKIKVCENENFVTSEERETLNLLRDEVLLVIIINRKC